MTRLNDAKQFLKRKILPFGGLSLLLLYLSCLYGLGLYLLTDTQLGWILLGSLLVAHSLILMAYCLHDCAHHSACPSAKINDRVGQILNLILGTAYIPYADIRRKHMRHHIDKVDVIAFDYRLWLGQNPVICKLIQGLEWCLIPATDLLFHGLPVIRPFARPAYDQHDRALRRRVLVYGASRLLFFALLGWLSPLALVGYGIAYCLMVTVLRIMDLPQHSYQTLVQPATKTQMPSEFNQLVANHRGDRRYEQQHTCSNPLGDSIIINFMVLNFGYHNEHHRYPTRAWFNLGQEGQTMDQQRCFWRWIIDHWWRYRCDRVCHEKLISKTGETTVIGSYGLSFLTVA